MDGFSLPALNACLNAASAAFVTAGFIFIRRKNVAAHKACMLAAVAASALFLASYLTHHYFAGATRYGGTGWMRRLYFAVLTTHTVLAVAIVPMVLTTLHRAWRERFDLHVRLARWTLPVWLYVSVTGILIYLFLYIF